MCVGFLQLVEVYQVGPVVCETGRGLEYLELNAIKDQNRNIVYLPVFVNQGIEGHAVSPAGGEIVNVDVRVTAAEHKRSRLGIAHRKEVNMEACY